MSRYFELFSQCRTFPLKAAGSNCDMSISINIGIRIVSVNRRKISISVCGPVVHKHKQCSFPVSGKTRKQSPVPLYKRKKIAAEFEEKLAEAIRKYTCLYNEQCPDFKDKSESIR